MVGTAISAGICTEMSRPVVQAVKRIGKRTREKRKWDTVRMVVCGLVDQRDTVVRKAIPKGNKPVGIGSRAQVAQRKESRASDLMIVRAKTQKTEGSGSLPSERWIRTYKPAIGSCEERETGRYGLFIAEKCKDGDQ